MPQAKTIFETSDGQRFDSQEEAREHELRTDLAPTIDNFLAAHDVKPGSRVRASTVASLMVDLCVAVLTPGKIQEYLPDGYDGAQTDSGPAQQVEEAGQAQENLEDQ